MPDNDPLPASIQTLLRGKENHPRYQLWFDEYVTLEDRHLKNFVPLLKEYTDIKDKLILDFGCGTGGSSVALGLSSAKVIGVEPQNAHVEVAQARVRKYQLTDLVKISQLTNTFELPFPNGTFDICVCHSVLEYITKDRAKYIKEMWRALKPGGLLFIAGTSNGIFPIEMHTGRWFINYLPLRDGSAPVGVSYWQIAKNLTPYRHTLLNKQLEKDGLTRYIERSKDKDLSTKAKIQSAVIIFFLTVIKFTICPIFRLPIDVFLPWLDVCFKKEQ